MIVKTAATIAALAVLVPLTSAQQLTSDGCLYITGSSTCKACTSPPSLTTLVADAPPPVQTSYVNATALADTYSFFDNVYDVSDFDKYVTRYFATASQWPKAKFTTGLGCSNASTAVIRYQQTVMCSLWVNDASSRSCMATYRESFCAPPAGWRPECCAVSGARSSPSAPQPPHPGARPSTAGVAVAREELCMCTRNNLSNMLTLLLQRARPLPMARLWPARIRATSSRRLRLPL